MKRGRDEPDHVVGSVGLVPGGRARAPAGLIQPRECVNEASQDPLDIPITMMLRPGVSLGWAMTRSSCEGSGVGVVDAVVFCAASCTCSASGHKDSSAITIAPVRARSHTVTRAVSAGLSRLGSSGTERHCRCPTLIAHAQSAPGSSGVMMRHTAAKDADCCTGSLRPIRPLISVRCLPSRAGRVPVSRRRSLHSGNRACARQRVIGLCRRRDGAACDERRDT